MKFLPIIALLALILPEDVILPAEPENFEPALLIFKAPPEVRVKSYSSVLPIIVSENSKLVSSEVIIVIPALALPSGPSIILLIEAVLIVNLLALILPEAVIFPSTSKLPVKSKLPVILAEPVNGKPDPVGPVSP